MFAMAYVTNTAIVSISANEINIMALNAKAFYRIIWLSLLIMEFYCKTMLPHHEVLAASIAEDLQTVLEQFMAISKDLGGGITVSEIS